MVEILRELAKKQMLSKQDEAFISEACKQIGLEFNPKENCKNCYFDQIFKIYNFMKKELEVKEVVAKEKCDYKLAPGIDVVHRGVRINEMTLTNENAKLLINDGLDRWFVKMPKNENK